MWDIVWVSPQGHRSVSVSRHFLLQAPQCPCSVRKRFSRDHCCREKSKPGCRIVGSHTWWELTTWADFQLCLHQLFTAVNYGNRTFCYFASSPPAWFVIWTLRYLDASLPGWFATCMVCHLDVLHLWTFWYQDVLLPPWTCRHRMTKTD